VVNEHIVAIILDYVSCLEFSRTHVSESGSLSIIRSKGANVPTQLGPILTATDCSKHLWQDVTLQIHNCTKGKSLLWVHILWDLQYGDSGSHCTVACRVVAMQRADIAVPFLGNGSVNTFLQQWIDMQQWRNCWKQGVSVWSVLRCYVQGTRLELSQLSRVVCEEMTWAGGRGIAIVGAITRKRLVTHWEH
jgi:hypothetical protein